jgi:hypothetical protein
VTWCPSYKVSQIAPGLLAWIDGTCEWELNRRNGLDYELQPPEAAIGLPVAVICHGTVSNSLPASKILISTVERHTLCALAHRASPDI